MFQSFSMLRARPRATVERDELTVELHADPKRTRHLRQQSSSPTCCATAPEWEAPPPIAMIVKLALRDALPTDVRCGLVDPCSRRSPKSRNAR
jgi:hypothetical protein